MPKLYLTKYALGNDGIIYPGEYKQYRDFSNGLFYQGDSFQGRKLGRDVFETEEQAIADVHAQIEKKIKSLKKQISKLEAMTPSVEEGE